MVKLLTTECEIWASCNCNESEKSHEHVKVALERWDHRYSHSIGDPLYMNKDILTHRANIKPRPVTPHLTEPWTVTRMNLWPATGQWNSSIGGLPTTLYLETCQQRPPRPTNPCKVCKFTQLGHAAHNFIEKDSLRSVMPSCIPFLLHSYGEWKRKPSESDKLFPAKIGWGCGPKKALYRLVQPSAERMRVLPSNSSSVTTLATK